MGIRFFLSLAATGFGGHKALVSDSLAFSPDISRRRLLSAAFFGPITGVLVVGGGTADGGSVRLTPPPAIGADLPASSQVVAVTSASLLSIIPSMRFDAPATNATIPRDLANQIEATARTLEQQSSSNAVNNAESPLLSGSWRLVYSNGPEITSLAAKLPLGFCLGKTYQPIEANKGFFENRGSIEHPAHLARLRTTVVGDVSIAPPGSLNAVGVVNDKGNRVNVDFRVITFELVELLGFNLSLQKTLTPKVDKEKTAQPANDVTYLDKTLRVVRGGDGTLFIFVRDEDGSDTPMLTAPQRDALFGIQSSANEVSVGVGEAERSESPELQFLFQGRK